MIAAAIAGAIAADSWTIAARRTSHRNYLSNYTGHKGTWLDKISNQADRSTSRIPR